MNFFNKDEIFKKKSTLNFSLSRNNKKSIKDQVKLDKLQTFSIENSLQQKENSNNTNNRNKSQNTNRKIKFEKFNEN